MDGQNKKPKGVITTGVIAALAASSCCIPPVIAAIAGVGGAAGSLSWVEPFRPYLIGLAIIAISYAWYNHYKPKQEDDCGCDIEKPKWFQTKSFLIGMTLFAIISITFPHYSGIFFSKDQKEIVLSSDSIIQKNEVTIEGMTCEACQHHVNSAVNELEGVINIKSSYSKGNAIIEFDNTRTSIDSIEKAINATGYTVKNIKK